MDSQSSCNLSPQARAFSTVLTAFIGSIVNGLTSGAFVAFLTGWISWLAVLRVLSGALFGLYQAFSPIYTKVSNSPPNDDVALEERGLVSEVARGVAHGEVQVGKRTWWLENQTSQLVLARKVHNRLNEDVTVLGWIGWTYTAVYSPIVQILWLAENWTSAEGSLKIVRALGISISALGLTIDTKKRYASKLRSLNYAGAPAYVAFNVVNAGSAFGMGVVCTALLIKGAIDTGVGWYFYVIYSVFAVIWAGVSFKICPVQDGGIKGFGIILDVLMGAFAGLFLAAPAFGVMMSAEQPTLTSGSDFSTPASGQSSLHAYLSCESVAGWQKFVAIFP